jgi:hypothetical protein
LNITNPFVAYSKIILPARIARIGFREALGTREPGLIGFQRLGQIALLDQNIANSLVAHREIALPSRIVGLRFRQARDDGDGALIRLQRAAKVTAPLLDIAKGAHCSIFVRFLLAASCKLLQAFKPLLRLVEIAVIDLNGARPIQALDVVRIERERFFVSLKRALGIGEARDRAKVAISNHRFLAVLFRLRDGFLGLGSLVLGYDLKELRGLGEFVFLQEAERLFQTRIDHIHPFLIAQLLALLALQTERR